MDTLADFFYVLIAIVAVGALTFTVGALPALIVFQTVGGMLP